MNEVARQSRILPGMRYSAAFSLDPGLRAGVVSDQEIRDGIESLTRKLWSFSPCVEPADANPGVFWFDAAGILPLYRSYRQWAERIREHLAAAGFEAMVAVGFSRFSVYAAARSGSGRDVIVFDSPCREAAHCRAVAIERLDFEPKLRDTLSALGIDRLGQFLDLPAAGIGRRFGKEAAELHRRAREGVDRSLDPVEIDEPLERRLIFDRPEVDLDRMMTAIESQLAPLMSSLYRRSEVLASVHVHLQLDDGSDARESLQPAAPTLDQVQVASLIRLRLTRVSLSAGVHELELRVGGVAATNRQLDLFDTPARDLPAARRALARVRAEFGEDAVVRARLQDGHLPEASFCWEKLARLNVPRPRDRSRERPLVRRYFPVPVELPLRSRHEPDGWVINLADGPVEEVIGPYVVSGGWWVQEVARDYYYVRTRSGRWLWIYNDRRRRRWFLHGEVE